MPGTHPKETATGVQFRITVPLLDANHFYRFIFDESESLPDAGVTEFRKSARAIIERHFDDLAIAMAPPSTITADKAIADALPELKRRVRNEIDEIKPECSTIKAPPGSLLDSTSSWETLKEKHRSFVEPLLDVAAAEENSRRAVNDAAAVATPLLQHLSPVLMSPLRRMFAAIQAKPATDSTRLLLADHASAIALTKVSTTDAPDIVNGADFASPTSKKPLTLDHSAAEITARLDAYRKLANALDDLQTLVRQLNAAGVVDDILKDRDDRKSVEDLIGGDLDGAATEATRIHTLFLSLQVRETERLAARTKALDEFTEKLVPVVSASVDVGASTLGDFNTFANRYVTADAGLLVAPEIHKGVAYLGVNFYRVAINRDVSLTQLSSFSRKTSLTLGLTAQSIADSGSVKRSDLFASQSLVVGIGYRLTDVFRLAAGGLVFNRKDPNPLVNRERLAVTPYFSISFDFNLAKSFNGIGKLFGGGTASNGGS